MFRNLIYVSMMALAASAADAGVFTTTFTQVGANVVAVGSGSFDLRGSPSFTNFPQENRIVSATGFFLFGSGNFDAYDFASFTGPGPFGTVGEVLATSWSGDQVGIWTDASRIYVPTGYQSGDPLANSATWAGFTLEGLGLTPGTFGYTFDGNTYNVVVKDMAAIPLPAGLGLLLSALAGLGLLARRRTA